MNKITILALSRNQHHHYAPLYKQEHLKIIETSDWKAETVRKTKADIVLLLSSDWHELATCIKEACKLQIPSLYIMDGAFEWRHQWESPHLGNGGNIPFNQPTPTDKIACLGKQSMRTLESWGNLGKCELTGSPRFDGYLNNTTPSNIKRSEQPKRLMIMTANTPGFTPEQVDIVERSLLDVQDYLKGRTDWEAIWRVRKGLDEKLGLTDNFPELRNKSLKEAMAEADAVLTTPSTVLLEAMLTGLPTAILDYTNSPHYVSAAWKVTAPEHLAPTLQGLLNPSARRLALQDDILHDCLECHSPATPRVVRLIEEMAQIGREARAKKQPLQFPGRILPVEFGGYTLPSTHFDLGKLYPEHPILVKEDLYELQNELIYARQELTELKQELKLRRVGYWANVIGMKISNSLNKNKK